MRVALTLFLPRKVAEYLSARAIREGKNAAAIVEDMIATESKHAPPRG